MNAETEARRRDVGDYSDFYSRRAQFGHNRGVEQTLPDCGCL